MQFARRPLLGAAVAVLTAAGALGSTGCGAAPHHAVTARAAAFRAPSPRPLYTGVTVVGSRGEGVLRVPEAIAVGRGGEIYVADQFSHLVQRFSRTGRFLGEWGMAGRGPGQFGTIGALATAPDGDVYVLDSALGRIDQFGAHGRFIRSWGRHGHRLLGRFEFGPGGGPDIPPGGGIAVAGGHVYVSDTRNNRIQRFRLDGSHPQLFGRVRLSLPRGLAASRNSVYVADDGNDRVVELGAGGQPLRTFGPHRGKHKLADPFGVAISRGRVYVVDDNGGRVVALSPRLRWRGAISGSGPSRLSPYLRGVAVDRDGRVYVTDTGANRIEVFTARGLLLHAWGDTGDGGGQLTVPLAVAPEPGGGFLVVGTYGSRSPIYLFSRSLHLRGEWLRGGGAIIGRHWFAPTSAAVAPDGSVWVTDQRNDVVRHLDSHGRFISAVGDPAGAHGRAGLSQPRAVAIGPHGGVYVADTGNGRIQRYSASGRWLGSLHTGRRLHHPVALAVTSSAHVYVADSRGGEVVELNGGGGLVRSWRGFRHPTGIAVDPVGDVFVADAVTDRISVLDAQDGRLLGTLGRPGAGIGELSHPEGLAVDCRGDLLVADAMNNRVQILRGAAAAGGC